AHLLSQIVAEDGDRTAQKLFDVKTFWDWINNTLQNQSGQVTLRDMFKLLCQYVYYSIVPNPVAKFDRGDPKKRVSYGPSQRKLIQSGGGPAMLGALQTTGVALSLNGEETETLLPKGKLQAALTAMKDTFLPASKPVPELFQQGTSIVSMLSSAITHLDSGDTVAVLGLQTSVRAQVESLHVSVQQALNKTITVPGGVMDVNSAARLRSQIFRPDCYMAAPPTCNVVFPEQFSQMTYERNYLDEVTRVELSCYSAVTKPDNLTAVHIVQPAFRNESAEVAKKLKNKWRILMDHELHTGIIAREEWLPDS